MKLIAKEILRESAKTIAVAALSPAITKLLLRWPSFRTWVTHLAGEHAPSGRTTLTIALAVSSLILFGLWVASEVKFFRLRERIRSGKVTLGDTISPKQAIQAMDIESAIRKRRNI